MKVLVLGGGGFIGRSVVRALAERGCSITIGSRFARRDLPYRCLMLRLHERTNPADWTSIVAAFDVVVNCVGILRSRVGERYDAVHHRAPAAIAFACAQKSVRFIHVSALGLCEHSSSGFIRSKWHGEQAIIGSRAHATVVRPSLLDGEGGFGAYWLRRAAAWPVHFVPTDAVGRIAPLPVHELGFTIAELSIGAEPARSHTRFVECGGDEIHTIQSYLRALRPPTRRPAWVVLVPSWCVRIVAHVCDLLHATPLSWGHVQLMRRDNVPLARRLDDVDVGSSAAPGAPVLS
jgi:uncharacterized protein YbjT (DUF2867 family)